MPWQLAVSLSILMSIIYSLIQRSYSQKSSLPSTFPPAISYALGVLPIGLISGFFFLPHKVNWSWWLVLLIAIVSFCITIGKWLEFAATKRLPVAQFQTIHQFHKVTVITLGWIILNEGLSKFQFIGTLLLFAAVILAIRAPIRNQNKEHKKLHIDSVLLTLTAALALGIGLVTEKTTLNHMDVGAVLIFGWLAETLGMIVLASKDINKASLKKLNLYEFLRSSSMGISLGFTGMFYIIAINNLDNISLITAITATSLPLLAVAAHMFLKERENQKILWASLITAFLGLLVSAIP